MKKIVGIVTALLVVSGAYVSQGALSWETTGDLADWDASVSAGWYVQMYLDTDGDTTLGSITSFTEAGAPEGGNSDDDSLLDTFKTLTGANAKSGDIQWLTSLDGWTSYYGQNVYSVLYNAADLASAGQAVVVDSSTYTLASSDPASYTIDGSAVSNSWVPVGVPEPTTIAFLGLGAAALALRKKIKA